MKKLAKAVPKFYVELRFKPEFN